MNMKLQICCLLLLAHLVLVHSQSWNVRSQYRDLFEHYPHLRHFVNQPRYSGSYGQVHQPINYGPKFEEEKDDYYPYEHRKKFSHKPEKKYHKYEHHDYKEDPFPDSYKHHFEDWAEKHESPHEPPHYGYLHHDIHHSKKYHEPRHHEYKHEYKHEISHLHPKEHHEPCDHKYHSNGPRDYEPNHYTQDNRYEAGDEEAERGYNDNFGFDSSPFDYSKLDFASSSDSFAFDTLIDHNQFADKRIHSPKRLAKILGL